MGAHTYSNYNYGTRSGCANTGVRPHAVYQVTVGTATRRYCYDANGNLTNQTISAGSGTVKYDSSTWWVANLAKRIAQGGATVYSDFWYGAGRERIRQFAQKSATTSEATSYVGGLYEKFVRNASGTVTTEHVHYVRGGGSSIAVVKRIAGVLQTRYLHKDHLGSVVALTDSGGAVLERYSYDPWGKRRDATTWVSSAPGAFAIDPAYTDRGFTGHEHVEHVGLVNMNGRLYDPELGKFLSADPTTQFPESTQGWNRYAYTGNNPLSYTDPSGFSFLKTLMKIVGIALQFVPGMQGWSLAWWQSAMVGFASGFLASGGDLKAALVSGVTAGLMNGIGTRFSDFAGSKCFSDSAMTALKIEKAAMEGLVGGAASAVMKGKFKDGFLGAFAGSISGSFAKLSENRVVATVQAAVVGGTVSAIGGGKFGNGAITATFAYVHNFLSHAEYSRDTGTTLLQDEDTGRIVTGQFYSGTDESNEIAPGRYAILERGDKDGFRLEAFDGTFGDDSNAAGQSLLRLHGPGRSFGCVTACDGASWHLARGLIQSTTPRAIVVNSYYTITVPGGQMLLRIKTGTEVVKMYGVLTVR